MDESDIDWCCDELQEATAVNPHSWEWRSAVVMDGSLKLVRSLPVTGGPAVGELGSEYSNGLDFTFRYCPFCGDEVPEVPNTE